MNDINLLLQKKELHAVSKKVLKILRIISFISLTAIFFLALILFLVKLKSPLPKIQAEENALLSQISASKEKAARLFVVHNRLSNVATLLRNKKKYDNIIQVIVQDTPKDVVIEAFSIDKSDVKISVSSSSLSSLNAFLNSLVARVYKKEIFQTITLQSLSLDEKTGTYFTSLQGRLL